MRTRAVLAGSSGGSDEGRLAEIELRGQRLHVAVATGRARPGNTASGLPPKRRSVKTSTVTNEKVGIAAL